MAATATATTHSTAPPIRSRTQRDDHDRRTSLPGKGLIPIQTTIQVRPSNLATAPAISPGPISPPAPTACNGPTSGTTTILPRPKPGRKPASDEPENKRKAQNRAAQRAFRERKLQGQQQLEVENKELKAENERLEREIQLHKNHIASLQAAQGRTDAELTESIHREHDLRSQLEINLSTLTGCEKRMREAEAKTSQYLNELHTLRAEAAILRAKVNKPIRPSDRNSIAQPSITNPVGGCDDCGKDGTCPCVDSYLQADEPPLKESCPPRHTMSVEAVLSPVNISEPAQTNSLPELISDHSSPEDMEIDFTHAFKPVQVRTIDKADKCGFCEDGSKCICAEAEAEADLGTSLSQNLSSQHAATSQTAKPGTCAQCQANPEQKAYCESLARARLAGRGSPEGEPASKRSRTARRDVPVPCADAYELYKRYSNNHKPPSYDEVYQDYVKTHPTIRRPTVSVELKSDAGQKQFSAYEADIAAVIATLHRQPPTSKSTTAKTSKKT